MKCKDDGQYQGFETYHFEKYFILKGNFSFTDTSTYYTMSSLVLKSQERQTLISLCEALLKTNLLKLLT